MYRLVKDYEKPEFGITSVMTDGVILIHERGSGQTVLQSVAL